MASSQATSSREENTATDPLADIHKMYVLVPPQHIKLGLMKNSIKAMSRNEEGFRYLVRKFPRISDAKIKEGTFVGPQIKWVMNDRNSDEVLEAAKKRAWKAFKLVVDNFLGIHQRQTRQLATKMLEAHRKMGCKCHLIHIILTRISFQQTLKP
jgi:hypothetical protein